MRAKAFVFLCLVDFCVSGSDPGWRWSSGNSGYGYRPDSKVGSYVYENPDNYYNQGFKSDRDGDNDENHRGRKNDNHRRGDKWDSGERAEKNDDVIVSSNDMDNMRREDNSSQGNGCSGECSTEGRNNNNRGRNNDDDNNNSGRYNVSNDMDNKDRDDNSSRRNNCGKECSIEGRNNNNSGHDNSDDDKDSRKRNGGNDMDNMRRDDYSSRRDGGVDMNYTRQNDNDRRSKDCGRECSTEDRDINNRRYDDDDDNKDSSKRNDGNNMDNMRRDNYGNRRNDCGTECSTKGRNNNNRGHDDKGNVGSRRRNGGNDMDNMRRDDNSHRRNDCGKECNTEDRHSDNNRSPSRPNNNKNNRRRNGDRSNYEDDEEEKYYYYPCKKYRFEEDCVSRVLASYSQCKPVPRYEQRKVIHREKFIQYLPNFNLTVTYWHSKLSGLDGKIVKFYINRKTNNLVYVVYFKAVNIDTKDTYYSYHRRGKEPVTTKDFFNVTFTDFYLTAVIPLKHKLLLNESMVTAYVGNPNPPFVVGPKVGKNKDPVVEKSFSCLLANIPIGVREDFLTQSPNFFFIYLQNYICDYGLQI